MNLTETNFSQFRNDVLNALAAVAEKYGCEATMGNIKYDMSSIDATLYFKAKGDNGEPAEEVDFKKNSRDLTHFTLAAALASLATIIYIIITLLFR
jgi:hypothetical protein